ncbi:MAG: esterase-like activity of phytase family protein [Pseudomonadota bacterium]
MAQHLPKENGALDLKKLSSLVSVALFASTSLLHAQDIQTFDVKSRFIENFRIGSNDKQFGPLQFVGGLEMIGSSSDFGAISGIALAEDQLKFVAVADTGFWIHGKIERDENNNPTGLTDVSMSEITGKSGAPISEKWQADAEGIIVDDESITVSFERAHRIANYTTQSGQVPQLENEFSPPVPLYELRANAGFEGIALAPETAPFAGALVGISEKSLDKNKNTMGFVQAQNGDSFEFSVNRKDEFNITDLAFLPDGNLIILERRFNVSDGIGMRLRHIKAADVKQGATVDGQTLMEADFLYQIDNMEGLTITSDDDGTPRLTLVSDDNHSLLQRNLLLEFRLTGSIAD